MSRAEELTKKLVESLGEETSPEVTAPIKDDETDEVEAQAFSGEDGTSVIMTEDENGDPMAMVEIAAGKCYFNDYATGTWYEVNCADPTQPVTEKDIKECKVEEVEEQAVKAVQKMYHGKKITVKKHVCPDGMSWSSAKNKCVKKLKCPPGKKFNPNSGTCVKFDVRKAVAALKRGRAKWIK